MSNRYRSAMRVDGSTRAMPSAPKPLERNHTHCIVMTACSGAPLEATRQHAGICADCAKARMANVQRLPLNVQLARHRRHRSGKGKAQPLKANDPRRMFNPTVWEPKKP